MSRISISPDSAGAAEFIIASPATSTNRKLTLPDATTTLVGIDNVQTLSNKYFTTNTSVLAATPTGPASIEIGATRSGSGVSFLDLVGDTTYTDFGTRLIRQAGSTGQSLLSHRGTGSLVINAQDSAAIVFTTNNIERIRIGTDFGQIGIAGANYGTAGQTIISGGAIAAPAWGTLSPTSGGTGITSYTIGDLIYASTSTALSKLADVATGAVLVSGGVGVAPAWNSTPTITTLTLTNALAVTSGGTGQASALTQYGVVYGSTTTAMASTTAGTTTTVLHGNAAGAPTFGAVSLTADVTGILGVGSGGTGVGTSTGSGSVVLSAAPTLSGVPLLSNATSGSGAIVGEQTFQLTGSPAAIGPTIADFFGTTSSISLEAGSVYEIKAYCVLLKTTANTVTWTMTASSAPTRMVGTYVESPITGIAAGAPVFGFAGSQGATTAAFPVTGSLTTGVNHAFQFTMQVQTNAAANFRMQITNTTGTVTPVVGSYYTVKKISASTGTFVA